MAEHYKTRYKTPTGRRKNASDFSAQRRNGRFPIARSKNSLFFRDPCALRRRRIRQVQAERNTKSQPQYGENPGTLFAIGSALNAPNSWAQLGPFRHVLSVESALELGRGDYAMNWPSMWEDIQDRAAESPPPERRKLSWKSSSNAQKVEFGSSGPGPSKRLRRPSQIDREAAQFLERLRERRATLIEARTRAYAADLRAWQSEIKDVQPLRRR